MLGFPNDGFLEVAATLPALDNPAQNGVMLPSLSNERRMMKLAPNIFGTTAFAQPLVYGAFSAALVTAGVLFRLYWQKGRPRWPAAS
jgi:hypothetical protein